MISLGKTGRLVNIKLLLNRLRVARALFSLSLISSPWTVWKRKGSLIGIWELLFDAIQMNYLERSMTSRVWKRVPQEHTLIKREAKLVEGNSQTHSLRSLQLQLRCRHQHAKTAFQWIVWMDHWHEFSVMHWSWGKRQSNLLHLDIMCYFCCWTSCERIGTRQSEQSEGTVNLRHLCGSMTIEIAFFLARLLPRDKKCTLACRVYPSGFPPRWSEHFDVSQWKARKVILHEISTDGWRWVAK